MSSSCPGRVRRASDRRDRGAYEIDLGKVHPVTPDEHTRCRVAMAHAFVRCVDRMAAGLSMFVRKHQREGGGSGRPETRVARKRARRTDDPSELL